MDSHIYGVSKKTLFFFTLLCLSVYSISALPHQNKTGNSTGTGQMINSNSVLVALLDSHYTELAELVEKALLLQTLEEAVGKHNVTIFAPRNEALERQLDPEFKRFLLEPGNLKSLQTLLLFHIIPLRVGSNDWPGRKSNPTRHTTLCNDHLHLITKNSGEKLVGSAELTRPDDVTRPDGVIHGIERLLIPQSVQEDFNRRRNLRSISAVLPQGAPEFDPRTHRLKKPEPPARAGLVSEGYVLTVLAPNDEAMAKLTTDQLSEPGAPEQIIYYHIIPEYQTEESMYNAVRRFGKIGYDTLRLPHKVVAQEADGSVKFGSGDGSAYLFDPDIYTDGRISVQGIDGVLFPEVEKESTSVKKSVSPVKVATTKPRRGKLMEVACRMLGTFGQDSHFTTCQ
ncbi:unnamed protein product [Dovyalis caffra]|uniref:FAS1 domain-containing protein n=1 Tax=Dovyalis caffra TaxID=77055 RepID=A0AAV1S193_9ROSI|nr:unnamed protein product [Dovyalis caffra]